MFHEVPSAVAPPCLVLTNSCCERPRPPHPPQCPAHRRLQGHLAGEQDDPGPPPDSQSRSLPDPSSQRLWRSGRGLAPAPCPAVWVIHSVPSTLNSGNTSLVGVWGLVDTRLEGLRAESLTPVISDLVPGWQKHKLGACTSGILASASPAATRAVLCEKLVCWRVWPRAAKLRLFRPCLRQPFPPHPRLPGLFRQMQLDPYCVWRAQQASSFHSGAYVRKLYLLIPAHG